MLNIIFIIAQIFSITGNFIMISSFWLKSYRKMMIVQVIALLLFTAQFIALGAYSGAIINIVNIIKTIYYAFRKKDSNAMVAVFGILILIGSILTWQNIISIFSLFAGLTYLFASYSRNTQIVRKGAIGSSICWVIYDIFTLAYSSAIFEIIAIISNIVAIIKNKDF